MTHEGYVRQVSRWHCKDILFRTIIPSKKEPPRLKAEVVSLDASHRLESEMKPGCGTLAYEI